MADGRTYVKADILSGSGISGSTTTSNNSPNIATAVPVWAFGLSWDYLNGDWRAPSVASNGASRVCPGAAPYTPAVTRVAATITAGGASLVTASAINARVWVVNEGSATLYILVGPGTVSATNYCLSIIGPGIAIIESLGNLAVQGIWSATGGAAQVTRFEEAA